MFKQFSELTVLYTVAVTVGKARVMHCMFHTRARAHEDRQDGRDRASCRASSQAAP